MTIDASFLTRLVEIVWINILLSGDNAVVIALACHTLPPRQRRWGIILGTAPAVILLIAFAITITYLMAIPYLKLVGGALLLWIAINLLKQEEEQAHVRQGTSLWHAVRIIVIADLVMSLDNVVAIAATAKGSVPLLVIGLAISVPIVIGGATILLSLLNRFPLLVTAGGALLGYIGGDLAVDDPAIEHLFAPDDWAVSTIVPIICAIFVVTTAHVLSKRALHKARRRRADES